MKIYAASQRACPTCNEPGMLIGRTLRHEPQHDAEGKPACAHTFYHEYMCKNNHKWDTGHYVGLDGKCKGEKFC